MTNLAILSDFHFFIPVCERIHAC